MKTALLLSLLTISNAFAQAPCSVLSNDRTTSHQSKVYSASRSYLIGVGSSNYQKLLQEVYNECTSDGYVGCGSNWRCFPSGGLEGAIQKETCTTFGTKTERVRDTLSKDDMCSALSSCLISLLDDEASSSAGKVDIIERLIRINKCED